MHMLLMSTAGAVQAEHETPIMKEARQVLPNQGVHAYQCLSTTLADADRQKSLHCDDNARQNIRVLRALDKYD